MRVRVYQPPGNVPCRIVIPNPKLQRDGESEGDFLDRICQHTETHNPELVGLPTVDMDDSQLPAERQRRSPIDGRPPIDVRRAWRVRNGRVVIDEAEVREDPR